MLETLIAAILPELIALIEIIGILVIFTGCIKAFYCYIKGMFHHKYYPIKLELGNALALGLEFKMGAEILKTVLIREMSEIYILGAVIVLRAILTVLIHFEVKAEKEHM